MLLILTLLLFTSCKQQEAKLNEIETLNTVNLDLSDTNNFNLVKEYILSVGIIREENASSVLGQEMMVTYYEIEFDSMQISVDHSDRIYMSLNGVHYGNILKEKTEVLAEISYGVPDKDPALTKEKETRVWQLYEKLIVMASKN